MSGPFFQKQYDPQTLSNFFGSTSLFQPRAPQKLAPVVGEFYNVQPKETSWTPGETTFTIHSDIPFNGNLLKDVWFEFTISALTAGAGTFNAGVDTLCLHDDPFYIMFEEIRLVDGGEVIERLRMRPLHFIEMHTEMDQRKEIYDERGWLGSETACNAVARAAKTYRVKIPFEFTKEFYKALRLNSVRSSQLSIEMKSNPKSYWWYSSDSGITSATFTITAFSFWMEYFTLGQSELTSLLSRNLSFPYKYIEQLTEGTVTASGASSTEHIIELPFLRPVDAIFVVMRDSTYAGYDKYWHSENDTIIEKAAIKADGKWRWEQMSAVWWMRILPARIGYRANNNVCVFPATYALNSATETGMLDCSALQNVYLHIWTTSALTYNYLIFAVCPNIMSYQPIGAGGASIKSLYDR